MCIGSGCQLHAARASSSGSLQWQENSQTNAQICQKDEAKEMLDFLQQQGRQSQLRLAQL